MISKNNLEKLLGLEKKEVIQLERIPLNYSSKPSVYLRKDIGLTNYSNSLYKY